MHKAHQNTHNTIDYLTAENKYFRIEYFANENNDETDILCSFYGEEEW